MRKKIIISVIIAIIIAIIIPYKSNAKQINPKNIINNKYICLAKNIDKIAYVDCSDTFYVSKYIVNKKIVWIKDKRDPSFNMKCSFIRNDLINCKSVIKNL